MNGLSDMGCLRVGLKFYLYVCRLRYSPAALRIFASSAGETKK
jgi:hypothetical protein